MPVSQLTIEVICNADNCTKYEYVQISRDLFTIGDLQLICEKEKAPSVR
jgi:hypothetical protein